MHPAARSRLRVTLAGLALFAPAFLSGQTPAAPEAPPPACSYSACALRVERGWFSRRIVQGASGTPLATIGALGPRLAPLVQRSDSAVAQARVFDRDHPRSAVIGLVGAVLIAVIASDAHLFAPDHPAPTDAQVGGLVGGVVLGVISTHLELRAERALSRALWWHNRELPRP